MGRGGGTHESHEGRGGGTHEDNEGHEEGYEEAQGHEGRGGGTHESHEGHEGHEGHEESNEGHEGNEEVSASVQCGQTWGTLYGVRRVGVPSSRRAGGFAALRCGYPK